MGCWSVKPSGCLANQQTTVCPAIYLSAEQPVNNSSSTLVISVWISGIGDSTYPRLVRAVGCGGAAWLMLANRWSSFGRILSSLFVRYMPLLISIETPRIDLRTPSVDLLCHVMYQYLYFYVVNSLHCLQCLQCPQKPLFVIGCK